MVLTTTNTASRLLLYDQYGAVAYGVILKIVPNEQQAQELLVDVFASPELQAGLSPSANTTCIIIRLARARALAYLQKQQLPAQPLPESTKQPELIFKLLFYQNQTPESIAERLNIQRSAVFGAVREFFTYLLPS